jgi:hypothetical protein
MKFNIKTTCAILIGIICIFFVVRIITTIIEGECGRLKKTVYTAKKLTEKEDVFGLTKYISADYQDELGNDKHSLLLIAKTFFDKYKNILILIEKLDIEKIEGGNADIIIEATMYWQENTSEDIIYDTVEVKAKFKKEQNGWKLIELKFLEPGKKKLFYPIIG